MATRHYIWDSEARQGIEEQELDDHFDHHRDRYVDLASDAHTSLVGVMDAPRFIQRGDLYAVLIELVMRDGELTRALNDAGIGPRRGKWHSWFTWYVVHEVWADLEGSGDEEEDS